MRGWCSSPARSFPTRGTTDFLGELERRHIPWHAVRGGERFTLDSVRFTVLHPVPGWAGWGEDLNEDSVVLLVEYRDVPGPLCRRCGVPRGGGLGGEGPAR